MSAQPTSAPPKPGLFVSSSPIRLGVNIDHVATLRNARGSQYPEPVHAAAIAEQAGADSITVHLREDRRHIRDRDVELLSQTLQTAMNLEMAVTEEMLTIAERIAPRDCCIVPESREELTTEGGMDIISQQSKITDACGRLAAAGIRVSPFVDADAKQIEAAHKAGAVAVELHTGHYANATGVAQVEELKRIADAACVGVELGLSVHAGHGLTTHNVSAIAAIAEITELNIGHALISRAIFTGLAEAVREFKQLMTIARQQ